MLLQLILIVGFQVLAVLWIQAQAWYTPHDPKDESLLGDDNYAVFAISVFQYISLAVIFSKGKPYRKAVYTNCKPFLDAKLWTLPNIETDCLFLFPDLFLTSVLVMTLFTIYIILIPHPIVQRSFEVRFFFLQSVFFFNQETKHIPLSVHHSLIYPKYLLTSD